MTAAQSFVAFAVRLITGARPIVDDPRDPDATVLSLPERAVYFANHSSHLDFLVVWAMLPGPVRRRVRPVAAADYWGSGWKGRAATALFNPYLVDRGRGGSTPTAAPEAGSPAPHRSQLDGMLEVLDAGDSLLIFPEGTRGNGHALAPFQAGLAKLARRRPDVPSVPVALRNLGRILPKGGVIPVPLLATATFLPAIGIGDEEPDAAFLERARALLAEALRDPEDADDETSGPASPDADAADHPPADHPTEPEQP